MAGSASELPALDVARQGDDGRRVRGQHRLGEPQHAVRLARRGDQRRGRRRRSRRDLEKQFDEDLDRSVPSSPAGGSGARTFSAWPRPWFAPSGACSEVRQGIGWAGALSAGAPSVAAGPREGARRRQPREDGQHESDAPPPTPYRLVPSRSAARNRGPTGTLAAPANEPRTASPPAGASRRRSRATRCLHPRGHRRGARAAAHPGRCPASAPRSPSDEESEHRRCGELEGARQAQHHQRHDDGLDELDGHVEPGLSVGVVHADAQRRSPPSGTWRSAPRTSRGPCPMRKIVSTSVMSTAIRGRPRPGRPGPASLRPDERAGRRAAPAPATAARTPGRRRRSTNRCLPGRPRPPAPPSATGRALPEGHRRPPTPGLPPAR